MNRYIFILVILCLLFDLSARDKLNPAWQNCVLEAIKLFPERGGYYTGGRPNATFVKTTMQGLNDAYKMTPQDKRPVFDPMEARPSFCSSATYAVLVKALLLWDEYGAIKREAWINMKPYVGIVDELNPSGIGQDDGVGVWGRANANGPGLGVLIAELGAGYNFTAFRGAKTQRNKETPTELYMTDNEWCSLNVWQRAQPGDLMKIFWNRNDSRGKDSGAIIGCNDDKNADQEAGHSVIFMGCEGDTVTYWSSNGPGIKPELLGYSMGRCHKTAIQRVVFTRITSPGKFDNARKIGPNDVNQYLYDLNGRKHSSTTEMKKQLKIKK